MNKRSAIFALVLVIIVLPTIENALNVLLVFYLLFLGPAKKY